MVPGMTVIARDEIEGIGVHEVDDNRLTLLPRGPDRLAALLDLIGSARQRLDLCFYIFVDDKVGRAVVDALIGARHRNVAVTLLVDAFGSAFTPVALFQPLIDAGARFGYFGKKRSTRYLIRNHQKMAVADCKYAVVGGFNIQETYFSAEDDPQGWRDLGLKVDGPLAADLCRWFDPLAEWTLGERQGFRALRHMVRDWQPGSGLAGWLVGGPTRRLNPWAHCVKRDLELGERLFMVEAYFSPGGGMVRRMNRIARRGVAQLVVPMYSDNRATIGAARHLYRRMLRAGLSVFEYRQQKLHTKLLVIDNVTYIGSANFDMRSLFLNVELMLRVDDLAFAQAARAEAQAHIDNSRLIDQPTYRGMAGPFSRFRWWLNFLVVGVLDYTVTRRLNFRRRRPR
jgi:cardiolipin synthase